MSLTNLRKSVVQEKQVDVDAQSTQTSKIPNSNQSRTKPIHEEDSVSRTSTTSLQSGSSHFMDIESSSFDSNEFLISQVYDDKKRLKQNLFMYAVTHNFQFKVVRSSTTQYEVHYFYDTCKWKLRANKIPHSEKLWIVKTYFGEHACILYTIIFWRTCLHSIHNILDNMLAFYTRSYFGEHACILYTINLHVY